MSSKLIVSVLMLSVFSFVYAQVNITGNVTRADNSANIEGAVVSLAGSGVTDVSDENGNYTLGGQVSVRRGLKEKDSYLELSVKAGSLCFNLLNDNTDADIGLYTLSGKCLKSYREKDLKKGEHSVNIFADIETSQIYLLRITINGKSSFIKAAPFIDNVLTGASGLGLKTDEAERNSLFKTGQTADTLITWAVGCDIKRLAIGSLDGNYDLALTPSVSAGEVKVIQTSQAGDSLAEKPVLAFTDNDDPSLPEIVIDSSTEYQSITGFGASFTETSVYILSECTEEVKDEILNAFFSPYYGSGYTLCRTHINSCDFSLGLYDYNSTPDDYELENFSIDHELEWMIPRIKDSYLIPGCDFKLFASPWAPPAWMKTTNDRLGGGELREDCYDAWALYFVKYIEAMENYGVDIWGVTVQNEPEYSPSWEGCRYTPEQERDFLKNSLGPTFELYDRDEKIMIFDHNKDHIVTWAETILGDAEAAQYASGTAYHRYAGDHFDNLRTVYETFPDMLLIGSENSVRQSYSEAERMAHEIIGEQNNGSNGYLTWNLLTDFDGGPYHHRDYGCEGPIVVEPSTGSLRYYYNYYYMTHFSKYVRPGAKRIEWNYDGNSLEVTAFKNTNGSVVVIIMNTADSEVAVRIKNGSQLIKPVIPAHSITDFIY